MEFVDNVYSFLKINWSNFISYKKMYKRMTKVKLPKLSKEEVASIRSFYGPYAKVPLIAHAYYTKMYGSFHPEFLPDPFYKRYVDKYFNNAKKAVVFENKCYFPRLFPNVKQAETVCYRLNGFWYTPENEMCTYEDAMSVIAKESAVIVKQAIGSAGGHGVFFLDNTDDTFMEKVKNTIGGISRDIMIQRPIRQHPELMRLNSSSINTIRVVSLLSEKEVKIYSTVLRIGINGMRVDNASSGGISIGIQEDGRLKQIARTRAGEPFTKHPTSGITFSEFVVPHFDELKNAIKRCHPLIPHFRLVSWDFAIDDTGSPVLIEANLNSGGINVNQINNGPLFGDDTKKILDEVFQKR